MCSRSPQRALSSVPGGRERGQRQQLVLSNLAPTTTFVLIHTPTFHNHPQISRQGIRITLHTRHASSASRLNATFSHRPPSLPQSPQAAAQPSQSSLHPAFHDIYRERLDRGRHRDCGAPWAGSGFVFRLKWREGCDSSSWREEARGSERARVVM